MNNNSKILFLGLTLLILFISVGSISATNDTTTTTVSDDAAMNVQYDMIKEKSEIKTTTSEKIKEENPVNKNKTQKQIKTEKQPKKAVEKTQTATDYETLKQSWNNIKNEGDNTTDYIINVKNGEYKFTEELEINTTSNIKSITINGEDTNKTIFNGQNITRHFNLNTTTLRVNFNNITFMNGNSGNGGSIYTIGFININNSNFIDNKAYAQSGYVFGGAININNSGANITNSYFINNKAYIEDMTSELQPAHGGAISLGYNALNVNIALCEFNNNSAFVATQYTTKPSLKYASEGGAIDSMYVSSSRKLGVKSSNFFNNYAYGGGAIYLSEANNNNPNYVINCVFANNSNDNIKSLYQPQEAYVNSNYYPDGTTTKSTVLFTANDEYPGYIFNQNVNKLTLKCVGLNGIVETPIEHLGFNYKLPVTSSSSLINTSDLYLSADNNYTTTIDLNNLPANYDDIILSVDGSEVSKIVWDYTNIVFSNITSKPGNNIILNATFKTSDNKLVSNGKVAFKINGKTIGHTNVKFGRTYFNYTIPKDYAAKDYKLSVVYGGTDEFIKAQQNATLTLNKLNTKTDVKTQIVNNTLKIDINSIDENNNTVTCGKVCVKINGKTQKTYAITGKTTYNFTIPKSWNGRDIKVLVIYGENGKYKTSRLEITTKIILSTTKTIKKENVINNYYVSAENGLDTNTGSSNSPFKTIQKAITTVENNKQTANIYLDGNFKGVGNTNLTVPGNLQINFIGVGNSSIDGEVNYTYNTDDGYYWGSSKIWEPFRNGTGNWAMNITKGDGLITISNFTIKNCWSEGEPNMPGWNTTTVTNNANLEVNNVSFINNHGGIGVGIRNNNGSNLKVLNSLFDSNGKSNTTGNYGAGIYNNGTCTIINSTFQKNYARWGTVTNDKQLTIINSTIRDNIGYDGGSTFKTGSGITQNTKSTSYGETYNVTGIITIIDGCTFINNDQLDVYADEGILNLTNNVFNKSSGIVVTQAPEENIKFNIINNTITSSIPSSLYNSLSVTEKRIITLRLLGSYNYTIESNKVLNITGNAQALELTANHAIIKNNTFERMIQVNGYYNQITNNNITSTKDIYAISLISTSRNNNISNNYLKTNTLSGNVAINYTGTTNTISDNLPEVLVIKVDEDTFYKYFDDDGNLLPAFNNIQQIQIIGNLTDKNININTNLSIVQTNKNIKSYNTTINLNDSNSKISDLIIENTNNNPVIILNSNNNNITGLKLKTNHNYTIEANGENNTITKNELIADILVGDEAVKTQENKNTIESNTPTYKNYILNDTTYNTYFETNGNIKQLPVNDIHFLTTNLNNKNIILNNNKTITIVGYQNKKINNITITTIGTTKLNISDISIENTNTQPAIEINTPQNNITNINITTKTNAIIIKNSTNTKINNSNIKAESDNNITAITIENSQNIEIKNNNITTTGPAKDVDWSTAKASTNSIEAVNTTLLSISNNNIITKSNKHEGNYDTIYSINIINNKKDNTLLRISGNNIITQSNNYAYAMNLINQTTDVSTNIIQTTAKTTTAIQATTCTSITNGIYENTIISDNNNAYGVTLTFCEDLQVDTNTFNLIGENITAISMFQNYNITIEKNNISLNATSPQAIEAINTQYINITFNNINTINQNDNIKISPIILTNSSIISMTKTNITTQNIYTITIDQNTHDTLIENNTLLSKEKIGDKTVEKLSTKNNVIRRNTPQNPPASYIYLNEKTYNNFFDENGTLKDDLPEDIVILQTGNLYNKILNITRPITIISQRSLYINTTMIITKTATKTNITGAVFNGEKTNIQIEADKCNIQIKEINIENINPLNITTVQINGNKNNIIVNTINIESKTPINTNIIAYEITGKQNKINTSQINIRNLNEVTAIKLENAQNNQITVLKSIMTSKCTKVSQVIINNSNNNMLKIESFQQLYDAYDFTALKLINSSNNIITGREYRGMNPTHEKVFQIEDNSNNNKIFGFTVTDFKETPITIKNSHHNKIYANSLMTKKYEGFVVNIEEGVGNIIKYNVLASANLYGDRAIIQENINDTINNPIGNNTEERLALITKMRFSSKLPETIKINQTFTIITNATAGMGSRAKPMDHGLVYFFINGEEVGRANVVNGIATLNYTLNETSFDILLFEAVYHGNGQNETQKANGTIVIEKLNTNIIMPNVVNDGLTSTLTTLIRNENGNIINDGQVVFKVDNMDVGVVDIVNGIAQIKVNTSKYALGVHNFTATYLGNDINAQSTNTATLTIVPYNVNIKVDSKVENNKATLIAEVCDIDGNAINNGRVVFKLNGKTLKDTNGNTIYANVRDGVATAIYILPEGIAPKDYILTAVSSDKTYNRVEVNSTLTVPKTTPKITIETTNVKRTNNTTITVKLTDDQNNTIYGNTKVAVKLNGKTITHTTSQNGIIKINMDLTQYKNSQYDLTIVSGENNRYNTARMTTKLAIE